MIITAATITSSAREYPAWRRTHGRGAGEAPRGLRIGPLAAGGGRLAGRLGRADGDARRAGGHRREPVERRPRRLGLQQRDGGAAGPPGAEAQHGGRALAGDAWTLPEPA